MLKRVIDSILILPTLANVQPPRFVESARKAWKGLQALPDTLDLISDALGDYDPQGWRTRAYGLEAELSDSRKHVASLEKQLAAVCGGLEAEKASHEVTLRKLQDAQNDLADADKREAELKGEYDRDRLMNQCSTGEVNQALREMFGTEKGEHETLTDALYRVLRSVKREHEAKVAARQVANEELAAELAQERAAHEETKRQVAAMERLDCSR